MVVLAGLGNPGPEHAGQRHNAGFMLLDRIAERHGFPAFKASGGVGTAKGRIGNDAAVLVKPLKYMNASGLPVREVLGFYKLGPEALTVAHDDIELAPGKVRVKTGGGHGGHNGLRDIDRHLGAEYRRLRIGVGRNTRGHPGGRKVDGHVLSDFTADERREWLDPLLDCMADEIGLLYGSCDNAFATRVAMLCPPPDATDDGGV